MESKTYSNGDITIIWKPSLCAHAGICVKSLPKVYTPKEQPWIHPNEATTEALIAQINRCPSGALTFKKDAHD